MSTVTSFERLHPHQKSAVTAVREACDAGRRWILVTLPSGAGKTSVCGQVAMEQVAAGLRVLYLTGRKEHLEQTRDALAGRFGLACYTDRKGVVGDPRKDTVLMSSVQDMSAHDALAGIPDGFFDLIVIDDADAVSADTYGKIAARFGSARVLGITSGDGHGPGNGLTEIFGDAVCDVCRTDAGDPVPEEAQPGSWDDVPPTRSQLACLARMGIDASTVHTKQQASQIIGSTPHATPTVKQIELLTRKGFRNVACWTYQQAHELITRISDNRWAIPADIGDPAAYYPC